MLSRIEDSFRTIKLLFTSFTFNRSYEERREALSNHSTDQTALEAKSSSATTT